MGSTAVPPKPSPYFAVRTVVDDDRRKRSPFFASTSSDAAHATTKGRDEWRKVGRCKLIFETKGSKGMCFQAVETMRFQQGVKLMSTCTALAR